MIDRLDLVIAVIGIAVSTIGSSMALGRAVSRRADKDRVSRFETRIESGLAGVEHRLGTRLTQVETKLDTLMRTAPNQLGQSDDRPA